MKRGSPLRRANNPQAKRPKRMEKNPSQREKDGFIIFVGRPDRFSRSDLSGLKIKKRLARINCGAREQAEAESEAGLSRLKNPENNNCFRDVNPLRDHAGPVVITFYYPDYTVGLGITPSHARFLRYPFPKEEIVTAQRGSWALPPIGNSLALFACRCHPAPKVRYLVVFIIT